MSATTNPNGRVAIVTGGSRGIGRETAQRLSKDGLAIVVNYAGNQEEAEAAVEAIADTGGKAVAVQADVPSPRCSMQPSRSSGASTWSCTPPV